MMEVASAYLLSILWIGCALLIAVGIALIVGRRAGMHKAIVSTLAGMLLIGISVFERVGWSSRPWRPGSPAQGFDDFLFRVLWLAGIAFIFSTGCYG